MNLILAKLLEKLWMMFGLLALAVFGLVLMFTRSWSTSASFALLLATCVLFVISVFLPKLVPYKAMFDRNANSNEHELLRSLQGHFPGIQDLVLIRLSRSHGGWTCFLRSQIYEMPLKYEAFIQGRRLHLDRIVKKLSTLLESNPELKAYGLAQDMLGSDGVQRVISGSYFIPSSINPDVEYGFTMRFITLNRGGRPLGSFCLVVSGESYPLWDVMISRILMVQGSEVDFLRTAHFFLLSRSSYMSVPMTRYQFGNIYGEEALERWDTYISSTPEKVTAR